jgi:hypothetical protein
MRRAWCSLVYRLPVALLVGSLVHATAYASAAAPAPSATATSFEPSTVSLRAGQSATITIAATGLADGATGAQFDVQHNPANTIISDPQCTGILVGANINQATRSDGDLLACTFAAGGASGTSGAVLTFTLTNSGGGAETISLNAASTLYLNSSFTAESAGATNSLMVTSPTSPDGG